MMRIKFNVLGRLLFAITATLLLAAIWPNLLNFPGTSAEASECKQHTWTAWDIYQEPDCRGEGHRVRHCTVCYEYDDDYPAKTDHIWGTRYTSYPTCTEPGYTHRECQVCYKQEYVNRTPATGIHIYRKWRTTKKATLSSTGTAKRECVGCDRKEEKRLDKLKPNRKENAVVKVAKGYLNGVKSYNIRKIRNSFWSNAIPDLFVGSKNMAKFCRTNNRKYFKYKLISAKVQGKKATVRVQCTYADHYDATYSMILDSFSYILRNPNHTTKSYQNFQYKTMNKYARQNRKRRGQKLDSKTINISLTKKRGKWRISKSTGAMANLMHCNYFSASDDFFRSH